VGAKMGDNEYSVCDCDWLDENIENMQPCGCGKADCQVYLSNQAWGDRLIHWRGKHWKIRCAFEAAVRELR